jgi:hypothetical protein
MVAPPQATWFVGFTETVLFLTPASTTAAGCGKFFFTFLLPDLLYDM